MYSHHVLFDYAVARLVLRGDPSTLVKRLMDDPELAIVIRPSFSYHFQHLSGISIIDSGPTDNIHLTAPECNRQPGFHRSEPPARTEGVRGLKSDEPSTRPKDAIRLV
jgi:hypothetical protein